jgi:NAD+ diphosphatase
MTFNPSIDEPREKSEPGWWFVFQNDKLLVKPADKTFTVPFITDAAELNLIPMREVFLGTLGSSPCYAAEISTATELPQSMEAKDLRSLFMAMDDEFRALAGRAIQMIAWDRTHQYCGACATPTETKAGERAKICPKCGLMSFPRLAPAIMAAVIRENKLLLANGANFPPGLFSVLAGFVEPGETLEACVAREVKEEVGITVKNLKYFGSQPWPFPHSLMIAFIAEYAGGEIKVDDIEIKEAKWFEADALPQRPKSRISISGQLIDWFEKEYR